MKMNTKNNLMTVAMCLAVGAGTAMFGCAHEPSSELVGARQAYGEAKTGPANELVPEEVYEAKLALDDAERAFEEDPGNQDEIHRAYIARRKAEIAMAKADRELAKINEKQAKQEYLATLTDQRNMARGTLESREESEQQRQLTEAQMGRAQAEAEAEAAMRELARIVQVQRDRKTDELVITVSGQVLFETGKSTLMPVAERRLEQVAEALKKQGDGQKLVIEGHTDSTGSDALNERLSRQRAKAVKDFFAMRGIDPERVEIVGRGESDPIATNDTPEGRANNRRVEIILKKDEEPERTARR